MRWVRAETLERIAEELIFVRCDVTYRNLSASDPMLHPPTERTKTVSRTVVNLDSTPPPRLGLLLDIIPDRTPVSCIHQAHLSWASVRR